MSNSKYEITDIAHKTYPFLHRIRALQDIGDWAKAGDLGGFVESESNLAVDPDDAAWIFNDAIACGSAYVDQDSILMNDAIACDRAYVSYGSALYGSARVENDAYLRGALMYGRTRASGCAQLLCGADRAEGPLLSGHCQVFGDRARLFALQRFHYCSAPRRDLQRLERYCGPHLRQRPPRPAQ